MADAVAAEWTAVAVWVASVDSAEILAVVAIFEGLLDDGIATVWSQSGAGIVAVPVLAGVLCASVIAELEAGANAVAAGIAAFGMLGDKTVERQSEVGLRQSIARLVAKGSGPKKPLVPDAKTKEEQAMNRRVEFHIVAKELAERTFGLIGRRDFRPWPSAPAGRERGGKPARGETTPADGGPSWTRPRSQWIKNAATCGA